MADSINIEVPGEMVIPPTEKRGLQKYVENAELVIAQIRSGAGTALILGVLANRRPWLQFVQTENFKAPASIPRLTRRFYRNVEYFQANYFVIFLGLFAYCLITSPLLLLAMACSFFGYRKLTSGPNTWKIGSWEVTRSQQYVVAGVGATMVSWFAGVGAVLFWVLGATISVVALHAGLYDAETLPQPDDTFPLVEQV